MIGHLVKKLWDDVTGKTSPAIVTTGPAPEGYPLNKVAPTLRMQVRKLVHDDGLKLAFRIGERLPWKGIEFKVAEVEPDRLTLIPIDTTSGFKKGRTR